MLDPLYESELRDLSATPSAAPGAAPSAVPHTVSTRKARLIGLRPAVVSTLMRQSTDGYSSGFVFLTVTIPAGSYLLLIRQSESTTQAGKWGLPGGKFEAGETSLQGVCRETSEETGIRLTDLARISPQTHVVHYPKRRGIYYFADQQSYSLPEVKLSHEHDAFEWICMNGRSCGEIFDMLEIYDLRPFLRDAFAEPEFRQIVRNHFSI